MSTAPDEERRSSIEGYHSVYPCHAGQTGVRPPRSPVGGGGR
jgi:hypothetical protein